MIPSEASPGPQPFGKYLLDREIARGGMARVHLARLRGLGGFEKRLVVKQILPALASDPRFVEMFVEEAKTLVQMSHPHIVPVYELGVVDRIYFLAMEYVEGATLADVLADGPLGPAEAAHAGVQICDALSYAHERFSIVHRDVTPRNVIVDAAGHCRLLDFGIAAPATDEAGGMLFGTPGYLSPEQARGDAIAAASDLYSLGAVLWHALSGETPPGSRTIDQARALAAGSPRPSIGPEIDGELAEIVERALDPDPAARFADARAMGRALRGWLASRHPEGVAPELGARAERARARRDRARASDRPPSIEAAEGTARIAKTPIRKPDRAETLAQSRALEEIIGGKGPSDPAPRALAAIESTEAGTIPIVGRSVRQPAPRAAPARSRAPQVIAALGALVVGIVVLGVISIPSPPPRASLPTPTHVSTAPPIAPITEPTPEPVPSREAPVLLAPAAEPPRPATPRPALLTVGCAGCWAEVAIDGRSAGRTPIRVPIEVRPGRHRITAANEPLGVELSERFEAASGVRMRAVVDFERRTIELRAQ